MGLLRAESEHLNKKARLMMKVTRFFTIFGKYFGHY